MTNQINELYKKYEQKKKTFSVWKNAFTGGEAEDERGGENKEKPLTYKKQKLFWCVTCAFVWYFLLYQLIAVDKLKINNKASKTRTEKCITKKNSAVMLK